MMGRAKSEICMRTRDFMVLAIFAASTCWGFTDPRDGKALRTILLFMFCFLFYLSRMYIFHSSFLSYSYFLLSSCLHAKFRSCFLHSEKQWPYWCDFNLLFFLGALIFQFMLLIVYMLVWASRCFLGGFHLEEIPVRSIGKVCSVSMPI